MDDLGKYDGGSAFGICAQIQNLAGVGWTLRECEDDFAGTRGESFPLRETRHDVSLIAFAAPTALETSAV